MAPDRPDRPERLDRLTKRQRECLRLVGQMRTSKQIAATLGISPHTVDGHVNEAVATLEAGTRYEAARLFLAHESTPQRLTGQPEPLASEVESAPSEVGPLAGPVNGRMIRLGPWQRIGIIAGLAIGLVYAVVLLVIGGDVIARYAVRPRTEVARR